MGCCHHNHTTVSDVGGSINVAQRVVAFPIKQDANDYAWWIFGIHGELTWPSKYLWHGQTKTMSLQS